MADDNPNPIPAVRNALQPLWLQLEQTDLANERQRLDLRRAFDVVLATLQELEDGKALQLSPTRLKRIRELSDHLGFEAGEFTNWPKLLDWSLRVAEQIYELHLWAQEGAE